MSRAKGKGKYYTNKNNKRELVQLFASTMGRDELIDMTGIHIPLTNGIGGEVIGDAKVVVEDGGLSISGTIADPKMLERLQMPAGSFSIRTTTLCEPCLTDQCDTLTDHHNYCRCCTDGHVV